MLAFRLYYTWVVPGLGVVVLDVVSGARVSYTLAYVQHTASPDFCGGVYALIVAAESRATPQSPSKYHLTANTNLLQLQERKYPPLFAAFIYSL
jgi:hypothetical protein